MSTLAYDHEVKSWPKNPSTGIHNFTFSIIGDASF